MPRTTSLSIHRRPADVLGHGKAPIWPLCTRRASASPAVAVCLLDLRLRATCRGPPLGPGASKQVGPGWVVLAPASGLLPSANGPPIGWLCACAVGSSPALAAVRCDAGVVRCAVHARPRQTAAAPSAATRAAGRWTPSTAAARPPSRERARAAAQGLGQCRATCAPRTLAMRCAALRARPHKASLARRGTPSCAALGSMARGWTRERQYERHDVCVGVTCGGGERRG
jgi:hypothetical protein